MSEVRRGSAFVAVIVTTFWWSGLLMAGVPPAGFQETPLVTGISELTGFEWAPNGDLWIINKGGTVFLMHQGSSQLITALTLNVDTVGERGLLGIAFDPNYPARPYLYLYYTVPGATSHNRVSRFNVVGDTLQSEMALLDGPSLVTIFHNSGCLRFGLDGMLYITMGDNAQSNSQNRGNLFGKILRIAPDGSIPPNNPFVSDPNARHEIWAYGLRNPWRFNVQPGTGNLFIGDVGDGSWEELDLGVAGANYGYPLVEGPAPPGQVGMTYPIYYYSHNGGSASITGGDHMVAGNFPAQYVGDYFFGDYSLNKIFRMRLDASNQPVSTVDFVVNADSPVHIRVGPDGALYYASILSNTIFRVGYIGGTNQQPVAVATAAPISGLPPFQVQFDGTGSFDPDGPGVNETWFFGDETPPSTSMTPAHTYTGTGVLTPQLQVSDTQATTITFLRIVSGNRAPSASIPSPANGSLFNAGDVISFSGAATDPEDGPLGPTAFTWTVLFHHQTHTHPFLGPTPSIANGTFTTANTGETDPDVWYEVLLTATDSGAPLGAAGRLSVTRSVNIFPNHSTFTLATAPRSDLNLTLDGKPVLAPTSVLGVVGLKRDIEAVSPQTASDAHTYSFSSWSDGGARVHTITTPSSSTTFTATFKCNLLAEATDLQLSPAAGGMVTLTWAPPSDLCLAGGPAVYHVYASSNSRPTSPPGHFPTDPAFSIVAATSSTSALITPGSGARFYLVVGIGSDGGEGPAGAYGQ